MTANIINHIGLILDESASMRRHQAALIKVVDAQIAHLARRSKELDQETRVSVWGFSDTVQCHVWDKDVLRLPSIATLYRLRGNTALIDATMTAIRDLAETPERYGDHSFLLYVATDGEENASRQYRSAHLATKLLTLPDNWTIAALVPNANGVHEAKRFGFAPGNIQLWDTSSDEGAVEMGRRIEAATEHYMLSRSRGQRSTRSLFSMDDTTLNTRTVAQANLVPLDVDRYFLTVVPRDVAIKDFVEHCGHRYVIGSGYYELTKPEDIQPTKRIALISKDGTERVWIGREARDLLGLPDTTIRVRPEGNASYRVLVQSTSVNRKLKAGQRFLYLTGV